MHRLQLMKTRKIRKIREIMEPTCLLTLNRATVSNLARRIGHDAVTSIGCCQGELEALLSMFIKTVVGVDSGVLHNRCPTAQKTVEFVPIQTWRSEGEGPLVADVPEHHAMLFCMPIGRIPFDEYVANYRGSTIVVIADGSCEPGPKVKIPGFKLVSSEVFPAPEVMPRLLVFKRT